MFIEYFHNYHIEDRKHVSACISMYQHEHAPTTTVELQSQHVSKSNFHFLVFFSGLIPSGSNASTSPDPSVILNLSGGPGRPSASDGRPGGKDHSPALSHHDSRDFSFVHHNSRDFSMANQDARDFSMANQDARDFSRDFSAKNQDSRDFLLTNHDSKDSTHSSNVPSTIAEAFSHRVIEHILLGSMMHTVNR